MPSLVYGEKFLHLDEGFLGGVDVLAVYEPRIWHSVSFLKILAAEIV